MRRKRAEGRDTIQRKTPPIRYSWLQFAILIAIAAMMTGCVSSNFPYSSKQLGRHVAAHHPSIVSVTGPVQEVSPANFSMHGIPFPFLHFLHGVDYSGFGFLVVGEKETVGIQMKAKERHGKCVWLEWRLPKETLRATPDEIIAEIGEPSEAIR